MAASLVAATLGLTGCSVVTGVMALQPYDKSYQVMGESRTIAGVERQVEVVINTPGVIDFGCTVFERERYDVRETRERWSTTTRVIMGSFVVLESIFGAGTYFRHTDDPDKQRQDHLVGGLLMADAVATLGFIVFLPDRVWEGRTVDYRPWRVAVGEESAGCPPAMTVEYAGRSLALSPSGRLAPDDERWLIDQLVISDGEIHFGAGSALLGQPTRTGSIRLGSSERCRLARAIGHPAAASVCPQLTPGAPAPAPFGPPGPSLFPQLRIRIDFGAPAPPVPRGDPPRPPTLQPVTR